MSEQYMVLAILSEWQLDEDGYPYNKFTPYRQLVEAQSRLHACALIEGQIGDHITIIAIPYSRYLHEEKYRN